MRTKALILAAGMMAAGALSSMAQSNVYSLNVVGYYNITVPAHGFNLVGNQLTGTNGDNTINTAFGNGAASDPNGNLNTACYVWNGAGYTVYQYFSAADAGGPAGYYDALGNLTSATLNQGLGCFLQNPCPTNVTLTVVGQVVQGSHTNAVPSGFTPFAIVPPVHTNIDSTLVGFPANSDNSGNPLTDFYFWNGAGYTVLNYFNAVDAAPGPAGWYDAVGNYQSLNPALQPAVGAGFFINNHQGPTNWISSFTVQ